MCAEAISAARASASCNGILITMQWLAHTPPLCLPPNPQLESCNITFISHHPHHHHNRCKQNSIMKIDLFGSMVLMAVSYSVSSAQSFLDAPSMESSQEPSKARLLSYKPSALPSSMPSSCPMCSTTTCTVKQDCCFYNVPTTCSNMDCLAGRCVFLPQICPGVDQACLPTTGACVAKDCVEDSNAWTLRANNVTSSLVLTATWSWSKTNNHVHGRLGFLGFLTGHTNKCDEANSGQYIWPVRTDHVDVGQSVMDVYLGRALADGAWDGRLTTMGLSGEWFKLPACQTATLTLSTSPDNSVSFDATFCSNCTAPDLVATVARGANGIVTIRVPR
jgi:hypothetical protein